MTGKLNILLLLENFDLKSNSRMIKLLKYLTRENYNMTCIVWNLISPAKSVDVIQIPAYPNPLGIFRLFKLYSLNKNLSKFFYIPDYTILFSYRVFRYLSKRYISYDAVISSSPHEGMHLTGYLLNKKFQFPWIADYRDQWIQDVSRYQPATRLHNFLSKKMEKNFYAHASVIVANTPPFGIMLQKEYGLPENKIFCITNGYDPDDFEQIDDQSTDVASNNHLNLGFSGHFEKGTKLPAEKVLQGIQKANLSGAKIKLNLYGDQSPLLKELVKKYENKNCVIIHEYKPHRQNLQRLSKNDILLLCLEESDYTDIVVPKKLYNYLMIPKPIVGVVPINGYAAEIIRSTKTGLVVSPNEDLGKAFHKIYLDWKSGHLRRETREETDSIKEFSWINLIKKWERAIHQCTGRTSTSY